MFRPLPCQLLLSGLLMPWLCARPLGALLSLASCLLNSLASCLPVCLLAVHGLQEALAQAEEQGRRLVAGSGGEQALQCSRSAKVVQEGIPWEVLASHTKWQREGPLRHIWRMRQGQAGEERPEASSSGEPLGQPWDKAAVDPREESQAIALAGATVGAIFQSAGGGNGSGSDGRGNGRGNGSSGGEPVGAAEGAVEAGFIHGSDGGQGGEWDEGVSLDVMLRRAFMVEALRGMPPWNLLNGGAGSLGVGGGEVAPPSCNLCWMPCQRRVSTAIGGSAFSLRSAHVACNRFPSPLLSHLASSAAAGMVLWHGGTPYYFTGEQLKGLTQLLRRMVSCSLRPNAAYTAACQQSAAIAACQHFQQAKKGRWRVRCIACRLGKTELVAEQQTEQDIHLRLLA